jgi:hypothetical protein
LPHRQDGQKLCHEVTNDHISIFFKKKKKEKEKKEKKKEKDTKIKVVRPITYIHTLKLYILHLSFI